MAEALDECTMRGMTPERIYLLARMGSTRAALELIMRELVDVEQAVQFCKEQDDPELWEDLIRCSLDKPPFIIVLLNNVGTHIDPRQLVERIEPGLEIPGLRQSLIQILRDYNLQVSLQEGCKRILVSDCYSLLTRKVRGASRGLLVSSEASCPECGEAIVRDPVGAEASFPSMFIISQCFHTLHLVLDLSPQNSTFLSTPRTWQCSPATTPSTPPVWDNLLCAQFATRERMLGFFLVTHQPTIIKRHETWGKKT